MTRLLAFACAFVACVTAASAQRLVGCDSGRNFYDVDMLTGTRTLITQISANAGTTGGLAYDAGTATMYLTSTSLDSLFTLDVATGVATLVGAYGDAAVVMHGLEYDLSTGTLYGISSHNQGLYTIDKTTGLATLVGTSGLTSFGNLAYRAATDTMYATNSGNDSFYVVDRTTGAQTLIGALVGPTNPNGMAYDTATDTIYLICNNTDTLYTIDPATGLATAVGAMGSSNMLGLAYIPGGSGSITRNVIGCGTTTINSVGSTALGGSVTTTLGGLTGGSLTFLGYGFVIGATPFCTCTVGHEWTAALFASTSTLSITGDPSFVGVQVGVQGAELFGTGGCLAPQVTLTDTMVVTIG
jgi:hypothetical protein